MAKRAAEKKMAAAKMTKRKGLVDKGQKVLIMCMLTLTYAPGGGKEECPVHAWKQSRRNEEEAAGTNVKGYSNSTQKSRISRTKRNTRTDSMPTTEATGEMSST